MYSLEFISLYRVSHYFGFLQIFGSKFLRFVARISVYYQLYYSHLTHDLFSVSLQLFNRFIS